MGASTQSMESYDSQPAVVDVSAHVVTKDGAASDMFANMQSPVMRTEERL